MLVVVVDQLVVGVTDALNNCSSTVARPADRQRRRARSARCASLRGASANGSPLDCARRIAAEAVRYSADCSALVIKFGLPSGALLVIL